MGRTDNFNFSLHPEIGLPPSESKEDDFKPAEPPINATARDALREPGFRIDSYASGAESLLQKLNTLTITDDERSCDAQQEGVQSLSQESDNFDPIADLILVDGDRVVQAFCPGDASDPRTEVVPLPPAVDLVPSSDSVSPLAGDTTAPPLELQGAGDARRFGANVVINDSDQITKISYPEENKTREFDYDSSGELNKLTTTTPEGKFTYVKEDGQWLYLAPDKNKYPAAAVMLDPNGEFSRVVKDGTVATQRPDGSSHQEELNALGARMSRDEAGNLRSVKRSDGSVVEASYDGDKIVQIVESEGGAKTTWKPSPNGEWTNDRTPPDVVKNLNLEKNGNITYVEDNVKHILRSNGVEVEEGEGRSSFAFDEQGRFKSITTPDGKKTRSFSYEGNSSDPSTIRIAEGSETRTYVHQEGGWTQFDQYNRSLGTWKGDIKIGDDGSYGVRAEGTAHSGWLTYRTDGKVQTEYQSSNGTSSVLTADGNLISAMRRDGTVISVERDSEGAAKQISATSADGAKINWSRDTNGQWRSDSKEFPDAVSKLSATPDGELTYLDANQARVTQRADGTTHTEKVDGSFVDADRDGFVRKTGLDQQNYRTFDYDEEGELKRVTDVSKDKSTTWERKPTDQEERKDIRVSADGFVSYKVDGKVIVEGSNLAKMELNSELNIAKLTMPSGSTRQFGYDSNGALLSVKDMRVTASGVKEENWNRVAQGENGKNRFQCRDAEGRVKTRDDVYVDDSGDYRYRSQDGKSHIARARDLLRASENSGNVEDARSSLEEIAQEKGMKLDRLKGFMDAFEKRCASEAADGKRAPTDVQIAKAYDNLAAVLRGNGGREHLGEAERRAIVEQSMYNMSNPRRINQGHNPTCNITTGEIFTASRYPDKYTDLMKQVSLSGQLTTSTGKRFGVDRSALYPTQEEAYFSPDADYQSNCRNYASHVFQIYGINAFTKYAPPRVLPTWGTEYRGGADNPCMDGNAIRKSIKEITGGDMPYIEHLETPTESKLWQYKKDGNFPIGIPTLYAQMQDGSIGEQHVQTIHDVREVNGRTQVLFDDQNGLGNDRGWVDLSEVYSRQGLQAPPQTRGGPRFTRSRR